MTSLHFSSEKTTSYRRTSSGGGSQGKCGALSPSCVGSQEELYCSLVGTSPGLTPAPAPAQSPSPTLTCVPRPRRNAMVLAERNLFYSIQSTVAVFACQISLSYKFAGDSLKSKSRLLQVSGSRPHQKRVKALADCRAVSSEQLTFFKDEIIVVTATSDPHWWVSATATLGLKNIHFSLG